VTRGRQWLFAAAFACVCAGAGFAVYQWRAEADNAAAGSKALMAATLPGLDGTPQSFAQWSGKVLVVNFWATWCAPCREEIPHFIRMQDEYAQRGVQFIGVAVDRRERVTTYARDIGMNYPVLVGDLPAMELSRAAGNVAGVLPYTLVLRRDGTTHSKNIGILSSEKLRKVLEQLI
jgi:thiol-disulfide isomerase/thioredoxin